MQPEKNRVRFSRLALCVLIVISGLLCLQPALGFVCRAEAAATTTATVPESEKYHPSLEIEHSASSAAIIETGRLRVLYDKNADRLQNIPAASKIMTALIACERLPLDTPVTISKVAAESEKNMDSDDGVELKTGDKYPLEYLLLRLLFYNSDAAAIAIAEQIANVEEDFVKLMNSRVSSFNLTETVFANCTGKPAPNDSTLLKQYTTPRELALLVSYAILDSTFKDLISKPSEYMVLSGNVLAPMSNRLKNIWTLSENTVSGAFYSELNEQAYMVAFGKVNDISIVAVTASGSPTRRIADLLALFNDCGDYYEYSPLVEAGDRFTGEKEVTTDGETFGLLYKKTVYYVHPVNDDFLKTTIRYNSYGPFSRPIQKNMTVGQVIMELKDDSTIALDVCPDKQILSSISILDKALGELESNSNLSYVLLITFGCLLLVMLYNILRGLRKLIYLINLVIFEKRSRR